MRKVISVIHIFLCAAVCVTSVEKRIRGEEGGTIAVVCPYDQGWETYPKIFNKGIFPQPVIHSISNQQSAETYNGRYSLYDDRERRVFTVKITGLKLEDADTYMCVINGHFEQSITTVYLAVDRAPPPPAPVSVTSRPLLSMTNPSISDSSNSTTVLGTPVVIIVCVSLTMLVLGLILLLIYKWRKNRKAPRPANHPVSPPQDYYNLTVVTQNSTYQTLIHNTTAPE